MLDDRSPKTRMRRDRIDEHTTIDSCFAFGRLQWIMASNALYDVQVKTEGCLPEYNEARKNILKELAEAISDAIEEGIQPKEYSQKNIKAEMKAGKPQKQAVAIAMNTARQAAKKAGKPSKAPRRK